MNRIVNFVSWSFACSAIFHAAIGQTFRDDEEHFVGPECPRGWIDHGLSCYSFSNRQSVAWKNAVNGCNETFPSHLTSINSIQESVFLSNWLEENDLRRQGWWTSGYLAKGRWEWVGDGSKVTFYPSGAHLNNITDSKLAYAWRNEKYVWVSMDKTTVLPFICELPKSKLYSFFPDARNIHYGLTGASAVLYKYGPRIITQPNNVITYSNGPSHTVHLSCKVDSYPAPTYRWIKASTGQEVIPSLSSYVIIDGTLVVRNVSGKDFGAYYCEASNGLATLRTRTSSFSSAYVKEFPKYRLDVYGVEGAGKSIPCESPSHFPQSQSFAWMYDTVKSFVHESDRVFISSAGALHFSYLTHADARKYACSIVIPELHTGYYGPFFTLKVDPPAPTSSLSSRPIILDEFPSIYPADPQVGSSAWIECFAYARPTPVFKWTRLDGEIGRHSLVQNYGHRLYFPRLYLNDSGVYRCTAENHAGVVSKEIRLSIQVSPRLIRPLADVIVERNGTALFNCDIFSVPRSDYEWFHNGKPLNPLIMPHEDQARIVIDENKLMVMMVGEKDAGIYQCFASNTVGQVETSSELVVRNVPPTFAKQIPDKRVYAFLGNNVRLPCHAESLPRRTITTWRHENVLVIPGDAIRIVANGDLVIDSVGIAQAGQYICTVENRLGVASASIMLILQPQLTVSIQSTQSPSDPDRIEYECLIGPDSNQYIDAARKWTFNCHDVKLLEQFRSTGSRVSLLRDEHVEGELLCRVDTAAGHASSSIKIVRKRVPMTPIRVTAHNVTLGGVHLSWAMPERRRSGSQEGKEELTTMFFHVEACLENNDHWRHVQTVHFSEALAAGGYLITGRLLPYSYYRFRVFAQNADGRSEASAPSNFIRTLAGSPAKPVTGLRATVFVSGEILLQWQPLDKLYWGSETIGYFIEWKFSNVTPSNMVKTSVTLRNRDADRYVIQASETTSCTDYEIDVSTFNEYRRGPVASVSVEPFILQAPSSYPNNVTAKLINSSSGLIRWNPLNFANEQSCRKSIGVKVIYWPKEGKRNNSVVSESVRYASLNQTYILLTDLLSTTTYTIQLALFNSVGDGPRSTPIAVTTGRRGPRLAPPIVTVDPDIVDGEMVAVVRWVEVRDGPVRGYKLHLYKSPWTIPYVVKVQRSDTVDWQPVVEISDLKSFQEYRLSISAFNEGGDGPTSEPIEFYLGGHSSAWSSRVSGTFSLLLSLSFYGCLRISGREVHV